MKRTVATTYRIARPFIDVVRTPNHVASLDIYFVWASRWLAHTFADFARVSDLLFLPAFPLAFLH